DPPQAVTWLNRAVGLFLLLLGPTWPGHAGAAKLQGIPGDGHEVADALRRQIIEAGHDSTALGPPQLRTSRLPLLCNDVRIGINAAGEHAGLLAYHAVGLFALTCQFEAQAGFGDVRFARAPLAVARMILLPAACRNQPPLGIKSQQHAGHGVAVSRRDGNVITIV